MCFLGYTIINRRLTLLSNNHYIEKFVFHGLNFSRKILPNIKNNINISDINFQRTFLIMHYLPWKIQSNRSSHLKVFCEKLFFWLNSHSISVQHHIIVTNKDVYLLENDCIFVTRQWYYLLCEIEICELGICELGIM